MSDGSMAGEGNPTDPAQARMQVSIHVQGGGAGVGLTGKRSDPHFLQGIPRAFRPDARNTHEITLANPRLR